MTIDSVVSLIDVLEDESEPAEVRERAARALGEVADPQAIPALAGALTDPEVQSAAVDALGGFASDEVAEPLLAAFYVWRALAESGDAALVPALRQAAEREGRLQRRTMRKIADRLAQGEAPQPLRPRVRR